MERRLEPFMSDPMRRRHRLDAHTGDNRHGIDARPNRPTHPLGFEGEGPRDAPR